MMDRVWTIEYVPMSDNYLLMIWSKDKAYMLPIDKELALQLLYDSPTPHKEDGPTCYTPQCLASDAITQYLNKSKDGVTMGDSVDMSTLNILRGLDNYEPVFSYIVSRLSKPGKIKLLYELAQIDFDKVFDFEQKFVDTCIKTQDLDIQEFALNTLEVWDNKSLIKQIGPVTIANTFLQRQYDNLLGVCL